MKKKIIRVAIAAAIVLVAFAAFTKSAFKVMGLQDISNNPVQSITFISQGTPPQKACELVDPDAINDFLNLLKKMPTIRVPSVQGGGGVVRAKIVQADGTQHTLQVYASHLASMEKTGVIIMQPRNFAKQVLEFVAICPESWD